MNRKTLVSALCLSIALAGCSNNKAAVNQLGYHQTGQVGRGPVSTSDMQRTSMTGGPIYGAEALEGVAPVTMVFTPDGPIGEDTTFANMIEWRGNFGTGFVGGMGTALNEMSTGSSCSGDNFGCAVMIIAMVGVAATVGIGSGIATEVEEGERRAFQREIENMMKKNSAMFERFRPQYDLNQQLRDRFKSWSDDGAEAMRRRFETSYATYRPSRIKASRLKKDRKRLARLLESLGASSLFSIITGEGERLNRPMLGLNYQYIGLVPFGKGKNRKFRMGSYVLAYQLLPGDYDPKSSFPVALRLKGFPYTSEAFTIEEWFADDGARFQHELAALNANIAERVEDRMVQQLPRRYNPLGNVFARLTANYNMGLSHFHPGYPKRKTMSFNPFAETDHTTSGCYATDVKERQPVITWDLAPYDPMRNFPAAADGTPAAFHAFDVRIYDQQYDLVARGDNLPDMSFKVPVELTPGPHYFLTFRGRTWCMDRRGSPPGNIAARPVVRAIYPSDRYTPSRCPARRGKHSELS